MRYLILLVSLALVGCSQATASKIGDQTYSIDGPEIPGGSSTPDRRLAEKICPNGYRVLGEESFKGGTGSLADRGANADPETNGTTTNWKIRCL